MSLFIEYSCLGGGQVSLLRVLLARPIGVHLARTPESLFVSLLEPRANATPEKQNGTTELYRVSWMS